MGWNLSKGLLPYLSLLQSFPIQEEIRKSTCPQCLTIPQPYKLPFFIRRIRNFSLEKLGRWERDRECERSGNNERMKDMQWKLSVIIKGFENKNKFWFKIESKELRHDFQIHKLVAI